MEYVVATLKSLASAISDGRSQSTATTATQKALASIFALTGIYFLLSKVLSFIRLIFSLFIIPGKPLSNFGPPRSWALITGASDGIGKEFALQLSRQNFSLLLVSRTSSKLASLAQEISSIIKDSNEVKTFAIDFASASDQEYSRLADLIKDLDISILINNVGLSHSIPVTFAQTPEKEVIDIITINNVATLRVSQLVIPGMISRRRGLILTMGSFGGLLPTPLLATYSGSKAFLQYWSSALGSELERYNITVELVQSYLVTSNMSKIRRSSAMVPTPRAFVRTVLSKIGRTGGAQGFAYSSAPFWSHALLGWAIGTLSGFTGIWLVRWNHGMHENIRKRALRKAERESAKKAT